VAGDGLAVAERRGAHARVLPRPHEVAGQREIHLRAGAQALQVDHDRTLARGVDPVGLALVDAQDEGRPVDCVPRLQPHAAAGVPHARDDPRAGRTAVFEHDRRLLEVDVRSRGRGSGQDGEENKTDHAFGGLDSGRALSYPVPPLLPEKRVV
jgi:hypothetical protein